jgi:hypothetical protein
MKMVLMRTNRLAWTRLTDWFVADRFEDGRALNGRWIGIRRFANNAPAIEREVEIDANRQTRSTSRSGLEAGAREHSVSRSPDLLASGVSRLIGLSTLCWNKSGFPKRPDREYYISCFASYPLMSS